MEIITTHLSRKKIKKYKFQKFKSKLLTFTIESLKQYRAYIWTTISSKDSYVPVYIFIYIYIYSHIHIHI